MYLSVHPCSEIKPQGPVHHPHTVCAIEGSPQYLSGGECMNSCPLHASRRAAWRRVDCLAEGR